MRWLKNPLSESWFLGMLSTLKVSEASVLWLANSLHSSKLSRCLGSVYISSKIANTSLIGKKHTTFFASILVQFSFLLNNKYNNFSKGLWYYQINSRILKHFWLYLLWKHTRIIFFQTMWSVAKTKWSKNKQKFPK